MWTHTCGHTQWHKTLAKFDLTVGYAPGQLTTEEDWLSQWAYAASKRLPDICNQGEGAGKASAKRIILLEERLERGDAHCFIVMANRAEGTPQERAAAFSKQEASVAQEGQVAREAWLLNTKEAPLKSCLAKDWEEDYAKSGYWTTI